MNAVITLIKLPFTIVYQYMDKSDTNKIIPSSLDDVKGTIKPKTKKPEEVSEDPIEPVDEQLGGSFDQLIPKKPKLKELKINFGDIKHL